MSKARLILQVFATVSVVVGPALEGLLRSLNLDSTREAFVDAFAQIYELKPGHRLYLPAVLLHRLVPGVRLM